MADVKKTVNTDINRKLLKHFLTVATIRRPNASMARLIEIAVMHCLTNCEFVPAKQTRYEKTVASTDQTSFKLFPTWIEKLDKLKQQHNVSKKVIIETALQMFIDNNSEKQHFLKTLPEHFNAVNRGDKTAELRLNDRDFHVGEKMILAEYEPSIDKFSGWQITTVITHILPVDQFIEGAENFVVLSFKFLKTEKI